jgi:aryl-alcohol dehydrogenase-like predicted oxidoreductase
VGGRKIGSIDPGAIGVGCNNFGRRLDDDGAAIVVKAALDAGLRFFDTADIYGHGRSEEYLGKAIRGIRDDVLIATKFAGPMGDDPAARGGSARWTVRAAEDSLRRLGTDRIDLLQMHFPDDTVPIAETLGALDTLVRQGKVLEVGCSNFSAAQIDDAMKASDADGRVRFVSAQNNYSLLERTIEQEVVPACERYGVGVIPYFPLANGVLTGKYRRDAEPPKGTRLGGLAAEQRGWILSDRNFDVVERLEAFATGRGRTLLELAISWLVSRPAVTCVIAGATRPEQVRANAAAASWALDAAELAEIDDITAG